MDSIASPYDGSEKVCSGCLEVFPRLAEHWPKRKKTVDGLNGQCRGCISAYGKGRRQANGNSEWKAWQARKANTDPFYLLLRSVSYDQALTLTVEDLEAIYKAHHGLCAYTGQPLDMADLRDFNRNPYAPSVERLDCSKPHTPENCVLALRMLNLARGDMDLQRFLEGLYSRPTLIASGFVSPYLKGERKPTRGSLSDRTITRIKELLAEGHSQAYIARVLGVGQSTVSKVKLGKRQKYA